MDRRTDARTDNVKTVYPLQTKFAGGIKTVLEDLIVARDKNSTRPLVVTSEI